MGDNSLPLTIFQVKKLCQQCVPFEWPLRSSRAEGRTLRRQGSRRALGWEKVTHWPETREGGGGGLGGLRGGGGLHTDSQNDVIDSAKSGGAGGRGVVWCFSFCLSSFFWREERQLVKQTTKSESVRIL